jgi:cell fate regulator YaaT (PSP1 superfamily)
MSCSTCPAKAFLDKTQIKNEFESGCGKLDSYDWLNDIPDGDNVSNLIEVSFKNTHKEFFKNEKGIAIRRGDYIAVAADRGHDIGQVSLTGRMALLQLKRKNPRNAPDKIVYRKATKADLEKWQMSRLKEKPTLIKSRQIAERLGLEMKISDVEYQGDGTKAIFYYIADGRVDFRELIKHYAHEFGIKIEMRQIGARQEAAMVGGIGSCGKELCCSSWRTNLTTVSTHAAKIQQLPPQCSKTYRSMQ